MKQIISERQKWTQQTQEDTESWKTPASTKDIEFITTKTLPKVWDQIVEMVNSIRYLRKKYSFNVNSLKMEEEETILNMVYEGQHYPDTEITCRHHRKIKPKTNILLIICVITHNTANRSKQYVKTAINHDQMQGWFKS